jgi:phytoene dehydrogenase-like protein
LTDWDYLYAQIIAATGWDWDQVDALTIPRYRALQNYWRDYPPAHLLLRALIGFKARDRDRATNTPAPFETLAALAPSGTLNVAALLRR